MSDAARDADEVAAYYAQGLERDRLDSSAGALELVRTQLLLERYLPAPPAVVADVGGGPGRYAVWLAERGYRVHLVDPVPLHVEQARASARGRPGAELASAEVGDARALELAEASVDAVLLLGPLYHLRERVDRLQALAEARRVCRREGVVIAAAISRFASTLDGLRGGYLEDPAFAAVAAGDRRTVGTVIQPATQRTSRRPTSIARKTWRPSSRPPAWCTRRRWPWRAPGGCWRTSTRDSPTSDDEPCCLRRSTHSRPSPRFSA